MRGRLKQSEHAYWSSISIDPKEQIWEALFSETYLVDIGGTGSLGIEAYRWAYLGSLLRDNGVPVLMVTATQCYNLHMWLSTSYLLSSGP